MHTNEIVFLMEIEFSHEISHKNSGTNKSSPRACNLRALGQVCAAVPGTARKLREVLLLGITPELGFGL